MKILVVDDSPTMRRMVKSILNQLGQFEVLEAENGREAEQLLQKNSVQLVITDWNMPNADGLELLEFLKGSTDLASLPVLMISIRNNREDIVKALQMGVAGYLLKPFTADQLRQKLEQLLQLVEEPTSNGPSEG